jgi:MYXO-CTERM domain-containing protein
MCTFKWALPCTAAADCGDGFSCQPAVTVSCSGGSSSGAGNTSGGSGGGVGTVEPVADMCTSSTSYPGSCHPLATTCATDADCPSSWTCQDNVSGGTGGTVGTGGIAGAGGASPATQVTDQGSASGSGSGVATTGVASGPADVAAPAVTRSCVAPSWLTPSAGVGGRNGSDPTSSPATGSGGTTGGGNDGTPPAGANEGGGATGGSTAGVQPTVGAGTGGTTHATDSKVVTPNDSGGCSVSPAGGSSSAGLLAGLGLGLAALIARRRRS